MTPLLSDKSKEHVQGVRTEGDIRQVKHNENKEMMPERRLRDKLRYW